MEKTAEACKTVFALGERCAMEKKFSPFRTMYPVTRNGVLFCFLGVENGWGKAWKFYPLQLGGLGKIEVDGFKPDNNHTAAYYGHDGKDGAMKALNEGMIRGIENGHFKDANLVRQTEKDRNASARKHLEDAASNLAYGMNKSQRKRDLLKALVEKDLQIISKEESEAILEASEYFGQECRQYKSSLERVRKELEELNSEK